MRSFIKTFTTLLLSAPVMCAFAACGSTDGNASGSSESAGEKRSELLLYKVRHDPDKPSEWTETYDYNEFGEISCKTYISLLPGRPVKAKYVTKYEYNDNKQLISQITDGTAVHLEREYDDSGLLVKEKRMEFGDIFEATYSYDEKRRVISINIPGSKQSTYTYNEDGSYTIDTVIGDRIRLQEIFDQNGLHIRDNYADGSKTVYTYNKKGDILTEKHYDTVGSLYKKEIYEYKGLITLYRRYRDGRLEIIRRKYYDERNNLIRITAEDKHGNKKVEEIREYKLFDVIK